MSNSEHSLKDLLQNSSWRVKLSALFLIAMYFLPLLTNIASITLFAAYVEEIKNWQTPIILLAGMILFFTSSFSITSTTLLSIACGYLFGWQSYPILLAMFTMGSLLGYFIAHWFDKGTIMNWIQKNETAYNYIEKLKEQENLMVFVMRLTPILPFTVTNILCSYLSIPLKNYFLMGLVGIGLRLMATIYTGTQIQSFTNLYDDPSYYYQNIVFLVLSLALFGILYYLVMKDKLPNKSDNI